MFKVKGSSWIKYNLQQFLFSYQTTPNSNTGQTAAELFLNRRLTTRLDLMLPDLGWKAFDKQTYQKATLNKIGKGRELTLGEEVLVQKFLRELK